MKFISPFFTFYFLVIFNRKKAKEYIINASTGAYVSIMSFPVILWIIGGIICIVYMSPLSIILSWLLSTAMMVNFFFTPAFFTRASNEETERIKKENEKLMEELRQESQKRSEDMWRAAEDIRERNRRIREKHERQRVRQQTTNPLAIKIAEAYLCLGLEATLDENIIKKAYRQKAKEFHPDNGGSEESFINIKQSYDLVMKFVKAQAI